MVYGRRVVRLSESAFRPIVCSRQRGLQSSSFGLRPYGDAPDADEALHCHVLRVRAF